MHNTTDNYVTKDTTLNLKQLIRDKATWHRFIKAASTLRYTDKGWWWWKLLWKIWAQFVIEVAREWWKKSPCCTNLCAFRCINKRLQLLCLLLFEWEITSFSKLCYFNVLYQQQLSIANYQLSLCYKIDYFFIFIFFSDGCPNLNNLHVSWCDRLSDNGIEALVRGCPRLALLICKGCHLVSVSSNCPYFLGTVPTSENSHVNKNRESP